MSEQTYKILIVEDDQFFRETVREIIEQEGFLTAEAKNGEEAKELIKNEKFDVIVSDIQMPQMTGVELVEWVRKIYDLSFKDTKELPIILMTGFAHILETQKAHDLGVQEFLSKPFEDIELISGIKKILNIKTDEEPSEDLLEKALPEFCRVSLEDFVADREMKMDVYVKLSEKKFIKIVHKGGRIDLDRIESYKKKGLHFLYIKRTDFGHILDFNIMLSKVVAKSDDVTQEKKKRFMTHTAEVLLENTFVNGVDEKTFNDARDFLATSVEVLTNDSETLSLLEILSTHADYIYAHSLGVSLYSVMIAKKMGWNSSANLFKLSFGGLMHDVGKKEFPKELLDKPRSALTYDERLHLESHVFRGKEILETLKSASSEVVMIAYQHHENVLGQGYPRQLPASKIHPMAKVVSTANEFCKYALKGPNNPGVPAQKALHLMETYKRDQLDKECMTALKKLIVP